MLKLNNNNNNKDIDKQSVHSIAPRPPAPGGSPGTTGRPIKYHNIL